jgi:hypothetical protein
MFKPVGKTTRGRDALANIVFVHGIGSGAASAWTAAERRETGSFPEWLSDDLEGYVKAPVNVWLVDYPAEVFRVIFHSLQRSDSVPQRGRMLLDQAMAQELASRPVIFIAHSLGGIIVKQMLRSAADAEYYRQAQGTTNRGVFSLALSTRLVIFMATPHDGSSVANLARALPDFGATVLGSLWSTVDWLPIAWPLGPLVRPLLKRAVRAAPFTDALKSGDPHLEDLGAWYRNSAPYMGIETKAYYENLDYTIKAGRFKLRTLRVVAKESANPGVSGCDVVPLEGDHASICKPPSKDHDNYCTILKEVKDVLKDRCPAFLQTHQAVLDVGQRFVELTDLKSADRLNATKTVVRPIERRLGRPIVDVEYATSVGCANGFATPERWQLDRAENSKFDLDRVILYAYSEHKGGPPEPEPALYVRQETERVHVALEKKKEASFIPLHYAVRALRTQVDPARLSEQSREILRAALEQVKADRSSKHKRLRDNLLALLPERPIP